MDKKAIDRLQNLVIAVLSVSAIVLLLQTPLFGDFSSGGFSSLFSQHGSPGALSSAEAIASPAPVRIVLSNNFVRYGADNAATSDALFESAGAFLSEALGSAQEEKSADEADFIARLQQPGLYFDFCSALPLALLSDRLGVSPSAGLNLSVRRCLLSPDSDGVSLYLLGEDGCFRFSCAVSAAALAEYLEVQEDNGAEFAAFLGEQYAHLSPYTLLLPELSERKKLTASNPLADFDSTDFLSRAEFNPHTQDRYAESSGTIVILEGQRILRLRSDGTVVYSGGAAEDDSLYRVSAAEHAGRSEAVSGARMLLASLLQGRLGEANLYLHSVEESAAGFTLFFDYAVDGTSVLFSDGTHAAEVSVTGSSVTAFTIHCRRYQKSENASLLLPAEQASAVCRAYGGGELSVAYIDSFGESVSADWVVD